MPDRAPLLRIFRDYLGREWEVSACSGAPSPDAAAAPDPEYAPGSLSFVSGEERRRLTPLPPGWFVAPDEQLSRWCESAEVDP